MKFKLLAAAAALAAAIPAAAAVHPGAHGEPEPRFMRFPQLSDGRYVLVVDLHTHSVFSDGHVWPTVRTWEAEKDGLDAMAITEHLEYQPHAEDIPHPDRNRAYELAVQSAQRLDALDDIMIIAGAEITRRLSPGHVNAVFIEDANPLLTIDQRNEDNIENAREALEEARRQNAFVFWNHPAWTRDFADGVLTVPEEQQALIDEGLLEGIEVANGAYFSEEALQVALDNNLTILGVSDIHGLIDYDYDIAAGEHRTVTLAIAEARTPQALQAALEEGRTVAAYRDQLVGKPEHVETVVREMLRLETAGYGRAGTAVLRLRFTNASPFPITLRNIGERRFNDATDIVTVPARGELIVGLNAAPPGSSNQLPLEIVNSFTAPGEHLRLTYAF